MTQEIKNQTVEVVAPWKETDELMAGYGYKKALITLGKDVTFHECHTEKSKTGMRARIRANVYDSATKTSEWMTLFAYPQSQKGVDRLAGFKKGMRLSAYVKENSRAPYLNEEGQQVLDKHGKPVFNITGTVSLTGLFERPYKKAQAKADAQA